MKIISLLTEHTITFYNNKRSYMIQNIKLSRLSLDITARKRLNVKEKKNTAKNSSDYKILNLHTRSLWLRRLLAFVLTMTKKNGPKIKMP